MIKGKIKTTEIGRNWFETNDNDELNLRFQIADIAQIDSW